jgi:hypothetical protein
MLLSTVIRIAVIPGLTGGQNPESSDTFGEWFWIPGPRVSRASRNDG